MINDIEQFQTLARLIKENLLMHEKLYKEQLARMIMVFPWDSHALPEEFINRGLFASQHVYDLYRLRNWE